MPHAVFSSRPQSRRNDTAFGFHSGLCWWCTIYAGHVTPKRCPAGGGPPLRWTSRGAAAAFRGPEEAGPRLQFRYFIARIAVNMQINRALEGEDGTAAAAVAAEVLHAAAGVAAGAAAGEENGSVSALGGS